jgi:serine/threonine protein kinase
MSNAEEHRDESSPKEAANPARAQGPETEAQAPTPRDDEAVSATKAYQHGDELSLEDSFDTSVLAAPDNSSSLGRLGKYDVLGVIGQGGMGVVLKGFDESLHRPVAIKVLARQLATSPTARRRFTREARAAAAINHPNVVTIHSVEEQQGLPFLVMELVNGESLHHRIKQQAPLPVADVLRLGSQVASGLAAAHAQGVIHRDIKPANVMLEENVDRVKITDFGLARVAMDNAELTSQGHRLGTPAYMSPEQVGGQQVDERTDLFSLGCVLYAMIVGRSPFQGTHALDAARKIMDETPLPLDEANPDVPPFLAETVDKLLAKNPAQRFASATEVADLFNHYITLLNQTRTDELDVVLRGESLKSSATPSKSRASLWIVLAVLIAIVAAATSSLWLPSRETVPSERRRTAENVEPLDTAKLPDPPLSGTITVGKSGDAQFSTIGEALDRAAAGATIHVLDDAEYDEAIVIDDAKRWRDIKLIADRGAKLSAEFPTSILTIDATPGIQLNGFRIEAFHGQHGIEIRGACPGTFIENVEGDRLKNDSPAAVNFVYLHREAAGTAEAPIVLRRLKLRGGGHGIAIGELAATEKDAENPVRWVRIEECTLSGPDERSGYRLFILNHTEDIVVTRNSFSDAIVGISFLLPKENQARRVSITNNTFSNLGIYTVFDVSFSQDELKVSSNLIVRADSVSGQSPAGSIPGHWFTNNVWSGLSSGSEDVVAVVARAVNGMQFVSNDPEDLAYLKPTPESFDLLREEGSAIPGRFSAELTNEEDSADD